MTPKRFNLVLTGVLLLLIVSSVGLTVYASRWLQERSEGIVAVKLDTAGLEEQKKTAVQARQDLEKFAQTRESVEKIVPKSKDQARAIAELLQIAREIGVEINSLTFPSSDLGNAAPKPAAPAEPSADANSSSATPSAPAAPSVSQAKPVEGLAGILGIDVTVSQIDSIGAETGSGMSYSQLLDFLRALERNRRTMQVKSIQIQPIRGGESSQITGYNLTLNVAIFVKP